MAQRDHGTALSPGCAEQAQPARRPARGLRAAKATLRHSSLDLTRNVYTDPSLLDVTGALAALLHLVLHEDVRLKARSWASTN